MFLASSPIIGGRAFDGLEILRSEIVETDRGEADEIPWTAALIQARSEP